MGIRETEEDGATGLSEKDIQIFRDLVDVPRQ